MKCIQYKDLSNDIWLSWARKEIKLLSYLKTWNPIVEDE